MHIPLSWEIRRARSSVCSRRGWVNGLGEGGDDGVSAAVGRSQ